MLKRKQYNYKNISLNYVNNTAERPPLVLLHGLSDRWQSYLKLIPFLIPYYSIYALDMRGHGLSSRAENYRIIDYAEDVESFLSASLAVPVNIIGHSLGAAVALYMAAQNSLKCSSICLIDPFIFKDRLNDEEFQKYFSSCLKVITSYRDIKTISSKIQEKGTLGRKRAVDLLQLDKKAIAAVLNNTIFQGFELPILLNQIKCPILILRGNPDLQGFITEEKAGYLAANLADCVVEYLDKSSHNVHTEQPLETAGYILNFLSSL